MDIFDGVLTPECRALHATCRRFAEREIRPLCVAWEEQGEFPRTLYERAAAEGLLGVGFPVEVGGSGGGPLELVMLFEGLLYGGSSGVVAGLVGSLGVALPALARSGQKHLIDTFVRPVLAGKKIASLAVTEPSAGSDVAGVRTRAIRDGDEYIVNGAKTFITSAVRADLFTTLVRTGDDPHHGLSFLVIERSSTGVSTSSPLKKTGWWASDTAEVFFDNVRVPVANLVGREGSGFRTVMNNFLGERLSLAASGVGTAKIALEQALAYARQREAFGRPLTANQVIRHRLADMATRVLAAQSMLYQVAQSLARGERRVMEVSMVKNLAAETAISVCHDAVQIYGGAGYMRETLVERLSRDARLLSIGGGTQEIMKEIISKEMGM